MAIIATLYVSVLGLAVYQDMSNKENCQTC